MKNQNWFFRGPLGAVFLAMLLMSIYCLTLQEILMKKMLYNINFGIHFCLCYGNSFN